MNAQTKKVLAISALVLLGVLIYKAVRVPVPYHGSNTHATNMDNYYWV